MVINMEWGSFDDTKQVLPVTVYDLIVDRESPNASKQVGEHFRLLICLPSSLSAFFRLVSSSLKR